MFVLKGCTDLRCELRSTRLYSSASVPAYGLFRILASDLGLAYQSWTRPRPNHWPLCAIPEVLGLPGAWALGLTLLWRRGTRKVREFPSHRGLTLGQANLFQGVGEGGGQG